MSDKDRRSRAETLAAENGTIIKDWGGKISVALTYPNYYHVGMSNLGLQTLYRLMNELDDVVCERFFLPEGDETTHEGPRSLESGRPLAAFDIIAFSISFENDYPNLLAILSRAGLPLWSSERSTPHPLIIAGGVTSLLNPEPIAPFVDCFLIGEAEAIVADFFDVYKRHCQGELLLDKLALDVPGAYVPVFYEVTYEADGPIESILPKGHFPIPLKRAVAEDLSDSDTFTTIITQHTIFDDACLIEVARGCRHGCRFCAAGYVYRPPRFRTKDQLQSCMERVAQRAKGIGLMAAEVSDVPDIASLCEQALEHELRLSFSSLRADRLSKEFLDVLRRTGLKTVAIAPDAGSERMRRVINKGISEQDVLQAAESLVNAGIPNLKLYFMVGLPSETISDVEAIVSLCKKVKHRFLKASRQKHRLGNIVVSLNCFIPKPFTPFQWVALEDVKVLKEKIKHVKDGLRRVPNVQVHADVPRWAYIQALLSRGDRRTAELLVASHRNGGNWPKTLKDSIINADFWVYRERPIDEILPWDFIDHGINKAFLAEEYRKAIEAKTSPPCHVGQCNVCGVC